MTVIIAGSRDLDLTDDQLTALIGRSGFDVTEVVCGCARGIDEAGAEWARVRSLPLHWHPPDWQAHGKAAGPIRNAQMADYADAAIVVMWEEGTRGSEDMIRQMEGRGKPVYVHRVKRGREER